MRSPSSIADAPARPLDPVAWFDREVGQIMDRGGRLIPTPAGAFAAERESFASAFPMISRRLAHLLADDAPAALPRGHRISPGKIVVAHDLINDDWRSILAQHCRTAEVPSLGPASTSHLARSRIPGLRGMVRVATLLRDGHEARTAIRREEPAEDHGPDA